jgi:hypothetical protein
MTIQYEVSQDVNGWESAEVEARAASVPKQGAVVQQVSVAVAPSGADWHFCT